MIRSNVKLIMMMLCSMMLCCRRLIRRPYLAIRILFTVFIYTEVSICIATYAIVFDKTLVVISRKGYLCYIHGVYIMIETTYHFHTGVHPLSSFKDLFIIFMLQMILDNISNNSFCRLSSHSDHPI